MMYLTFSVATAPERRETVILVCPDSRNPYYVLHKLGVEYAMSQEGIKVRGTGLTFGELFTYLTPEMLKPYGMKIIWPEREVVRLEDGRQIVSYYEIQSHLDARLQERKRTCAWERKLRETAEKYARRLERLKAEEHPIISTWDTTCICRRSISWAYQYTKAGDLDADKFFNKKLADAMRKAGLSPQDTDGGEQDNIPQSA